MRDFPRLMLVLLLGALLVSCKHDPTLVGKWTGQMFGQDVAAEFKEDKSVTADIKAGEMGATFTGTYEVKGKNLTLNFASYKPKNIDEKLMPLADSFLKPYLNKPFAGTYHFNNGDEFALTYQGKTDILKRVKEE